MRVLHLADVHLDRPFVGLARAAADGRRRELWATFRRCLVAAREHQADVVTIGGDLWEDENVTANTRRSLAHELERLQLPVLLICGNHDPLLPGGNYRRTDWPSNVHLFELDQPSEYRQGGVSVWGVSWTGGQLTADFLERFRVPQDGRTHLLLLHGTAQQVTHLAQDATYCAFTPARLLECGFRLCLAGHIHAGVDLGGVVYPGSPEPLGWDETGRHCYALVDVATDGNVRVELRDVNARRYVHRRLECSGMGSSAEMGEALAATLDDREPEKLFVRVELVGELDPEVEIHTDELAAPHSDRYAGLILRNLIAPTYDLNALATQQTARGRFVRRLRTRIEQAADERERETLEIALLAALRALDQRKELV